MEQDRRYVVINSSRAELKRENLKRLVSTPIGRTTLDSWLTPRGRGITTNGESQFTPSPDEPSRNQIKKLVNSGSCS